MNNVVEVGSSECSSGCESGWTVYLQHSTTTFKRRSYVENRHQKFRKMTRFEDDEDVDNNNNVFNNEKEEDLSMVSDASSGPPLLDRRHYTAGNVDNEEEEEDDDDDDDDSFYDNNEGVMSFRKQCIKSYPHETQCFNDDNYNYNYIYNSNEGDLALDDTASSHVFTSKKIGGNNKGASFERFIDYSSQCYSSTHVKVNLGRRS